MEMVSVPAAQPKLGRPRIERTPEIEATILYQLASGIGLSDICKDKTMPSYDTVFRWQRDDKHFAWQCARAREAAGGVAADRLLEINRKVESGELEAAAANVISGNLKWIASKLNPRTYGDKITLSGDEENPIAVKDVTKEILGRISQDQLEMIERQTLTKDTVFDKAERSFRPKEDATVVE